MIMYFLFKFLMIIVVESWFKLLNWLDFHFKVRLVRRKLETFKFKIEIFTFDKETLKKSWVESHVRSSKFIQIDQILKSKYFRKTQIISQHPSMALHD